MPPSAEPMTRTLSRVRPGREPIVNLDAGSLQRMGPKRVVAEPPLARGSRDLQAEDAFDERAVRLGADPCPGNATGREHERIGGEAQRARRGLGVDRDDPPAVRLDRYDVEADLDPPAARQDPSPQRIEQAQPGHRWRQARHLERAPAEHGLHLGARLRMFLEAEDGRQADAPVPRRQRGTDGSQRPRAPRRVVECASQHLRTQVVQLVRCRGARPRRRESATDRPPSWCGTGCRPQKKPRRRGSGGIR